FVGAVQQRDKVGHRAYIDVFKGKCHKINPKKYALWLGPQRR
ncbi:MAG: hypothetical protein RL616_194, partial [Verrucomicrobiota bacterium]